MYGCNCHIGCLSGSITRVGSDREESFGLSGSITRVGSELRGYARLVCSVNKEGRFWMWNAGKKLLWDNNIEIDF